MQRSILTLAFSVIIYTSHAQTETTDSKVATGKFVKYYNANQADSIFNLLTSDAKNALPFDKTKTFIDQLHAKFGSITSLNFETFKNGFGIYKAQFDRGVLTLSVATIDKSISGLFAKPYQAVLAPKISRNLTKMTLPFKGEWTVFWGGDTKEQNYHVAVDFQKNAFDIIMTNTEGKSYKTNGQTIEDYYAFGQPLLAPCDGEVVLSVDGIKDNIPGSMNPIFATGNTVLIKTSNNEYILLAHFKQHSIKVKQGDVVKRGQILGLCGNSGNSSEPHLHFHIQDAEDFTKTLGVKCYFDKLQVNGVAKKDYSPVKGDKIKQ